MLSPAVVQNVAPQMSPLRLGLHALCRVFLFLAFNSSDTEYAGDGIPVLLKGDLQIVLTSVHAQLACDWGCGGKGFRDICDL